MLVVVPTENSGGTVETKKRGRTENLKPWKPGQSGNPGGRPKRDIAAEIAAAAFEMDREGILKAVRAGLKSKKLNPKLFEVLADRGFGKPSQTVHVPGLENLPEMVAAARKRANAKK